jgi:DNA-binding response OmpR family regulator
MTPCWENFAVDTAADGEEGHYLGDTESYDAAVLDLGLPKMPGANVLRAWRRARLRRKIGHDLIQTVRGRGYRLTSGES